MEMSRYGEMAPEIEATSTKGKVNLKDYKGKWVVLFSHRGMRYTEKYTRGLNALYYRCLSF